MMTEMAECEYCDVCTYRRQRQRQKAAAAAKMELSWTSSGSDATDAITRAYDQRLTRSAPASTLGYLDPATSGDIYYSGESSSISSTPNVTLSTPTSSSSSAPLPHSGSPDVQYAQQLHRSSPLAALNSIYVIDHHVTGSRSPAWRGGGVVNDGFVGEGILTDSWRRVSWRARLRAGIARSTISSDSSSSTTNQPGDASAPGQRPSYLSDVIDSVTFFSNAGGSASTHACCQFPPQSSVGVERCQSDGGEWTLRRDRDKPVGHRQASLVSRYQRDRDHPGRQEHVDRPTYYTYTKHVQPSSESTPNQRAVERV